jgi:predicted dehydrogenase
MWSDRIMLLTAVRPGDLRPNDSARGTSSPSSIAASRNPWSLQCRSSQLRDNLGFLMSNQRSRRHFLAEAGQFSALAAATAILPGAYAGSEVNLEPIRLGLIGCGAIMRHHVKGLAARKDAVQIAWLCDVDPSQIEQIAGDMGGLQSTPARRTLHHEDVVSDPDVDAIIIATPHHWHAPIALAAMSEGKDVYIEKPISHVYDEGPRIVEAARKYRRVVQQGSQMRSSPVAQRARKLLEEGIIGEIKVARAWTAETRRLVKPVDDGSPPSGVDYDRWLGPAPERPFNRLRFHQTWRMFRDYGNGEIGDDGIHDIDMAAWALKVNSLPTRITARGSRMLLHGNAGDYPDNMHVTWEFADGRMIVYENYPFTSYGLHGFDNGNVFYGTEGYMIFSRRGAFNVFLGPKNERGPTEGAEIRGQRGYAEHMAEFLKAVRSRTPTCADPLTAHLSCALVHLGEIASRTEGRLDFDPKKERFVDCEDADRQLSKEYRNPYSLST